MPNEWLCLSQNVLQQVFSQAEARFGKSIFAKRANYGISNKKVLESNGGQEQEKKPVQRYIWRGNLISGNYIFDTVTIDISSDYFFHLSCIMFYFLF